MCLCFVPLLDLFCKVFSFQGVSLFDILFFFVIVPFTIYFELFLYERISDSYLL